MKVLFINEERNIVGRLSYPFVSYSDPQVRYELGKLRGSLDILNEEGRRDAEAIRNNLGVVTQSDHD